uniref:Calmodulin n=1 Tax=Alexandrium monilatum TaxID=311494 RepID=A0A7S4QJC1_9DINO
MLSSQAVAWRVACAVWRFVVTELGHLDHLVYPGAARDVMGLLSATALLVPLVKKLGTSPIIAFLLMGVLLGPSGFDLISSEHEAHVLAEFGIIFFLFEMGLELSIEKVLSMKYDVFGLGFAQYVVTGLLIAGCAHLFVPGLPAGALVVLGGALALSTSAFVLQLIKDKGQLGTRYGRASLGVLLFQDMAVVPLLVVVPLLAGAGGGAVLGKALAHAAGRSVLALAIIVVVGKFVINRIFFLVSSVNSSEAFLSVTFLTVLLCSSITEGLGLSNTLGAFFGGVLLAETNYRHQIEADIAPFRGMLLGLFFVTVGFSIDLGLLASEWATILPLILGLLAVKALVVAAACAKAGLSGPSAVQASLLLAPGGEFAFVAFGLAERLGLISLHLDKLLVTATALSMSLTPVMARLGDWLAAQIRAMAAADGEDAEGQAMLERVQSADRGFVVVCGYGRIGKVVCNLLDVEETVSYIAFDIDPAKAIEARREGLPVFLADCTRREVLENFKVKEARLVVIAVADKNAANQTATAIRQRYPKLPMLVRAMDNEHQDHLTSALGVTAVVPQLPADSVLLSLPFGGAVLRRLGFPESEIDGLLEEERRKIYDGVAGPKGLVDAFKLLDDDGDGKLSRAELRRGLSNVGKSMGDEEFERLYVSADINSDGWIDYQEFAKLMVK